MVTLENTAVPHVLLAERIELLRFGVAKILRGLGCAVWGAADGNEALDLARVIPGGLDLMVLDTRLPGMDGLSVAHSLRSGWPRAGATLLAHAKISRRPAGNSAFHFPAPFWKPLSRPPCWRPWHNGSSEPDEAHRPKIAKASLNRSRPATKQRRTRRHGATRADQESRGGSQGRRSNSTPSSFNSRASSGVASP
jgi:hypothetical protein